MCAQVLGKEADGLSSDRQHVLVSQGSQRLVKQLLGDSLETKSTMSVTDQWHEKETRRISVISGIFQKSWFNFFI